MRHLYVLSILFLVSFTVSAQEGDTVKTLSKGRIFTSLYGTLTNQTAEISSTESIVTNGYTLGTKSGKFLSDNWVFGLNFSLSKSGLENNFVSLDNEELLLGLWTRFYFGQRGDAALYAEITPNYTAIFRENVIHDVANGNLILSEEVSGAGFGLIPGIGFTYLINKNVGFGMTLSYSLAWLNVETRDFILDQIVSDSYTIKGMQFSFNFEVYLDQFFF